MINMLLRIFLNCSCFKSLTTLIYQIFVLFWHLFIVFKCLWKNAIFILCLTVLLLVSSWLQYSCSFETVKRKASSLCIVIKKIYKLRDLLGCFFSLLLFVKQLWTMNICCYWPISGMLHLAEMIRLVQKQLEII